MLGARQVDLAALYREVGRRGGAGAVTERKQWKAVARALGREESAKAAATLRSTFDAFLGSYARRCAANSSGMLRPRKTRLFRVGAKLSRKCLKRQWCIGSMSTGPCLQTHHAAIYDAGGCGACPYSVSPSLQPFHPAPTPVLPHSTSVGCKQLAMFVMLSSHHTSVL